MEWDYGWQPEGEEGGEIQAMGGGLQIASVDQFPKPQEQLPKTQEYKSFKGKAKGKGKFKPRQTQHVDTFQHKPSTPQFNPPGLPQEFRRQGSPHQIVARNLPRPMGARDPTNEEEQYHWGLSRKEINPSMDVNGVSRDIEMAINGIDQLIEKGWEKINIA